MSSSVSTVNEDTATLSVKVRRWHRRQRFLNTLMLLGVAASLVLCGAVLGTYRQVEQQSLQLVNSLRVTCEYTVCHASMQLPASVADCARAEQVGP